MPFNHVRIASITVGLAGALTVSACGSSSASKPAASAAAPTTAKAATATTAAAPTTTKAATATTAAGAATTRAATATTSPAATAATSTAGGKINANTASQAELQAGFEAAGISNAAKWAREVTEYRPYRATDANWSKLRQELAKYGPSIDLVDKIIATLAAA